MKTMLLALIFIFLICKDQTQTKIYSYIKSVIIWTVIMYFSLEGLSVFHKVTTGFAWGVWILTDIILLILYFKKKKKRKYVSLRSKPDWLKAASLIVVGIVTFFLALWTVPNNYDSMTYHLPRIMHWAQNGSVAHYATNGLRQITSPVLAEFINLFVYVMGGKHDYLLNLVQWSAYVTNAFLVMGIAKKLKCNSTMCYLAGLLFMTMPIAFAESMTTQNDLLDAMWILMFAYVILDFYESERVCFDKVWVEKTVILSCCIAFGYLTKPSAMFAVVVFAIGLLITCVREKFDFFIIVRLFGCSIVTIILLLTPELFRNFYSFHTFSAPIAGANQLVATLNVKYLFINMLKNLLYNMPNSCFGWMGPIVSHVLYYLAYLIGVNMDAESISEGAAEFRFHNPQTYHHDTAINPVIFWSWVIGILLAMILHKKAGYKRLQIKYCLVAGISFVVFCIFLRWEVFVTRYMISYLALLCPVIAVCLNELEKQISLRKIYFYLIGVFLFLSVAEVVNMAIYHFEAARHTEGIREVEYFHNWKEEKYEVYKEISDYIEENEIKSIGLLTIETSFEYPLWGMLDGYSCEIRHIGVENISSMYEDKMYQPDCIFVNLREHEDSYIYNDAEYIRTEIGDDYTYLLVKIE